MSIKQNYPRCGLVENTQRRLRGRCPSLRRVEPSQRSLVEKCQRLQGTDEKPDIINPNDGRK